MYIFRLCMSNQSSYIDREAFSISFSLIMTDRGISRTEFLKEGENCNIPALTETLVVLGVGLEHSMFGTSCIELQLVPFFCYVVA